MYMYMMIDLVPVIAVLVNRNLYLELNWQFLTIKRKQSVLHGVQVEKVNALNHYCATLARVYTVQIPCDDCVVVVLWVCCGCAVGVLWVCQNCS